MKPSALANRLLNIGPNPEPMTLIFYESFHDNEMDRGREKPGSTPALIKAVAEQNAAAVKKHLSLGADPEARGLMRFSPTTGPHQGLQTALQDFDALDVAARRGASPEIVKALIDAALLRRPKSRRPIEALVDIEKAATDFEKLSVYTVKSKPYFFWGAMTPERHQAVARSFIEALPPETGLPWEALARESHLAAELALGVRRLAEAPEETRVKLANEALPICVAHRRLDAAAECLSVLGSRADLEPARVEAAILGDAALERELSLPIHAYAIAAGEASWALRALELNDIAWTRQPAPLRPFWGPLAAALDQWALNKSAPGLAQSLINAGAPLEALTASPLFKTPLPLLAQRAAALDASGVRLLLLSGANPASLSQPFELNSGGKATALSVAALAGDEGLARLLLSAGADPLAIPGAQLRKIAEERPELRPLLGEEGAISRFSRSARRAAAGLLQPAAEPLALAPPLAPAAALGSLSSEASLDVSLALCHAQAAKLSEPLQERLSELSRLAQELAPGRPLAADPSDALALRRLWEINIPKFLSRLSDIPPADRDAPGDDGEPSAEALLEGALGAAQAAMGVMRQRALQSARSRLSAEAAVICSGAGETLLSFQELIDKTQARGARSSPDISAPSNGPRA